MEVRSETSPCAHPAAVAAGSPGAAAPTALCRAGWAMGRLFPKRCPDAASAKTPTFTGKLAPRPSLSARGPAALAATRPLGPMAGLGGLSQGQEAGRGVADLAPQNPAAPQPLTGGWAGAAPLSPSCLPPWHGAWALPAPCPHPASAHRFWARSDPGGPPSCPPPWLPLHLGAWTKQHPRSEVWITQMPKRPEWAGKGWGG